MNDTSVEIFNPKAFTVVDSDVEDSEIDALTRDDSHEEIVYNELSTTSNMDAAPQKAT